MNREHASTTDVDSSKIRIVKELAFSEASSIFEVELEEAFECSKLALKIFHDNGDPGYTEKGRDLNRFRCELNAYKKLMVSNACARNVVPKFYGVVHQMDPAAFYPTLQHFSQDKFKPNALLFEYLPNAESLNCVNYSESLYPQAIEGIKEIHKAGVHHQDIYPKNILLVRGNPDKLVWIDFDISTTFIEFGAEELAHSAHEVELVKSFGELLVRDSDSLFAAIHNKN